MTDQSLYNGPPISLVMDAEITGVPDFMTDNQTFVQCILTESLLSPALQVQIVLEDIAMTDPKKVYDVYKGKNFSISAYNPNIPNTQLDVTSVIYRMEKRKYKNRNTESYNLMATDSSLLTNQQKRVTQQWSKKGPHEIVNDALGIVNPASKFTEVTTPIRDYSASNIHPFEIINAQSEYAMSSGGAPDMMHYMTFENGGTHWWRSLSELTKVGNTAEYYYADMGAGNLLSRSYAIMSFEFPCEFDLLSDISNGVGSNPTVATVNPFNAKVIASAAANIISAGPILGAAIFGSVFSNKGTTDNNPQTAHENAIQYRAARMSLIQPDRISLRMTFPFNPNLHAGQMIGVHFPRVVGGTIFPDEEYGSGEYLIVSLTHSLKLGGYGLTSVDCVSRTVGDGVVS